jgi:hypothetical protein
MEGARFSGQVPVTAGGILIAALGLYRQKIGPAWTIVAMIAIPAQVLAWIMVRVSLSSNARALGGAIYSNSTAFPTVAITLLGFLSAILTMGALSRLLVETYTARRADWKESLGYASARLGPLVVLAAVSFALLTVGYSAFIVPGLFLTVAWCAAVPVLMFESVGPIRALGRSWELVRGHWWTTFGALIVALAIIVGISFIVDALVASAESSSSITLILTLQGISRAIAAILTYPFLAAVAVVIYAHLRSQKEGVAPQNLMPRAM